MTVDCKIYADNPRKYSKRGLRWSHVTSPDPVALRKYANLHGLKRKHRTPFTHYDVTAAELVRLPGLTRVGARDLLRIMGPYRVPKSQGGAKRSLL